MDIYRFNHPFLKNLNDAQLVKIEKRLVYWGLKDQIFEDRLDDWFNNFGSNDQSLALKLFFNIDYYSEARFERRIKQAIKPIQRKLAEKGLSWSDVLIVISDDLGDSSVRHAYAIDKAWKLSNTQIINIGSLTQWDMSQKALIFFNDTHGSGNQFLREIWDRYDIASCGSPLKIIAAANIAQPALDRFSNKKEIVVWPDTAVASIKGMPAFSASDVERLRELGQQIYPAYPLGYGDTGLLIAYSFQCPNNTLPLIWADGENNGTDHASGYPWSPLFPYRPKISSKGNLSKEDLFSVDGKRKKVMRLTRSDIAPSNVADTNNNVKIRRHLEWFVKELNKKLAQTMLLPLQETPSALEQIDFFTNVKASPIQPNLGTFEEEDSLSTVHPSFGDAFKELGGQVLLLGVPGAGKTTTLFQFTRDSCRERISDPTKPVPYFTSVQHWDHKTPLHTWVRSQIPSLSNLLLESEPLLYIFDGLDELGGERPIDPQKPDGEKYDPRTKFLEAVAEQLPHSQVVISCREHDYIQLGTKAALNGAVQLLPLDAPAIQRVLVAKGQENLWQALDNDAALLELAQTPLLLTLLSSAVGTDKGPIDIQRGDITAKTIFDYYIDMRYEHEAAKRPLEFDLETTRSFLQRLSVYRWETGVGDVGRMTLFYPEIETSIGKGQTERFLQQAFSLGFLRPISSYAVQFIHLKFRDHCALPHLLNTLNEADITTRCRAIEALGEISDPTTVPTLLTFLSDANEDVRLKAAEALGEISDSTALPVLQTMLANDDVAVQFVALERMKEIRDPTTIPALLHALNSKHEYVRSFALEALGEIQDPRAIPALIDALNDQESDVRQTALIALAKITDPRVTPALIGALGNEDSDVRRKAVFSLAKTNDPSVIPALFNLLTNHKQVIALNAAKALGRINDSTIIPALLNTLRDKNSNVRRTALIALGETKSPSLIPVLVDALGDADSDVRSSAARALAQIKDPSATPALIEALSDKDYVVRASAAQALGNLQDLSATPALVKALRDKNLNVRWNAAEAIGTMNAPATIPILRSMLTNNDRFVRAIALEALGRLQDPTTIPVLLNALTRDNINLRLRVAEALCEVKDPTVIPALISLLTNDNASIRLMAVEALGETKSPSLIPVLVDALGDADSDVRSSAARALAQIKDPSATPALIEALSDKDYVVRASAAQALGNLQDLSATPALVKALRDKNSSVRSSAAQALAEINDPTSISVLLTALNDENSMVRWSVAEALEAIQTQADWHAEFIEQ